MKYKYYKDPANKRLRCKDCQSALNIVRKERQFGFLMFIFHRTVLAKYYECTFCKTTFELDDIKVVQEKKTDKVYADGTKETRITSKGMLTGSVHTTITTDRSNTLPKVKDETLLVTTVISILSLAARLDPANDLAWSEKFDFISKIYPNQKETIRRAEEAIDDMVLADAQKYVSTNFKAAVTVFNREPVHFILEQVISPTRYQTVLKQEVEQLFKSLLDIYNIVPTRMDSFIDGFRR